MSRYEPTVDRSMWSSLPAGTAMRSSQRTQCCCSINSASVIEPVVMAPTRTAKPFLLVAECADNSGLKPLSPVAESGPPLFRHDREQLTDKCHHATHDLNARGAIEANFVKREDQEILPGRKDN